MIQLKISVIVAAYKVEEYLGKCIESIINQTYDNLEIILVDDGSPDSCGLICDHYASKDNRIKVIHKGNGGQATARNMGLDIATGDYIGFVDGDDWIEPNMYEELVRFLENNDAEIAQCGWYVVDSDGVKKEEVDTNRYEIETSDGALIELIESTGRLLNTSVCCKLFKKEIAKSIRFSPVRAYEDDEYIFRTVSLASKIACFSKPLYNYYTREGSTMTASFNINKLALVTIQSNICSLLKTRLPNWYDVSERILCSKQFYILHCLLDNPQIDKDGAEALAIQNSIMRSYSKYMTNPRMGLNKLMLILMKYSPKWLWRKVLAIKFS